MFASIVVPLLAQTAIVAPAAAVPAVSELTSLGAAGLMGAMWLWERYTSRTREEQLTATHERVMGDHIQLDALVDLVKQNTQAMTRLSALIEAMPKKEER